jgi:hypothetical protein
MHETDRGIGQKIQNGDATHNRPRGISYSRTHLRLLNVPQSTVRRQATRIVLIAATTKEKIIVIYIPAHVSAESRRVCEKRNNKDVTLTQYRLQLKDLYRQIDTDLLENWNLYFRNDYN